MADQTPPLRSRRVHTPPAPRLGAQDDEWSPFTPRRSSRVAAQRDRRIRASTPTKGNLALPTSSHTISPPSSPISPSHSNSHFQSKLGKRPIPTPRKYKQRAPSPLSSETEIDESKLAPHTIFPTPARTPRKKQLSTEALHSTSRVLFHPRLVNPDDAMPTPKKSRKSKIFSLNPLHDMDTQTDKIEVYEDSKDRVPTVDQDEDNPFLVAPNTRKSKSPTKTKTRNKSERDRKIEEAARNEEGMVYVFRGRKVFRRFADNEEDDNLSDLDIQRRTGVSNAPRLTRTSIKPRILFPTEEQKRAKDAAAAEEADEEALTDIEMPRPSNKQSSPVVGDSFISNISIPELNLPTTPPLEPPALSTGTTEDASAGPSFEILETEPPAIKRINNHKRGRTSSPFDRWTRTKHTELASQKSEAKSSKRQGSPMEKPAKRTRSGSFTMI